MITKFELIDGKIYLSVFQAIWGEDGNDLILILRQDITETIMPIVDDYLDHELGLTDYKYTKGRLSYTGKDKYEK